VLLNKAIKLKIFPFQMAAVRHLGLQNAKFKILKEFSGGLCIIMQNFDRVTRAIADIWLLIDL